MPPWVEQARQQNVADLVVDRIIPLGPLLLDQPALEAEHGGDGRHLARVVGLDIADGDQGVTALRQGIGGQPFQLAHLVAAIGETGGNVVTLGPEFDTKVLRHALQLVQGRWEVTELDAGKTLFEIQGHSSDSSGERTPSMLGKTLKKVLSNERYEICFPFEGLPESAWMFLQ